MNRIEALVRRIDGYQQRHAPLAAVFGVVKKFGDDRAGSLAAQLAYYGFVAVFPLLLLLTTITGFVAGANSAATRSLQRSALRDFPIIGNQLAQSLRPLRGSGVAVVVGILGLLWGALGVTQASQLAMAQVWNVPGVVRPNFVGRLARGLGFFGAVGLGLVATTVLASFATFGSAAVWVKVVGALASIALNVAIYMGAFRLTTPALVPTRELLPGAALGGVGWSALQALGGYLVGHQLRHAGQVYGYFASVLGLMSWLYLGAQVSLYAAELNVVWARRLWPRSIVQPPLTDADRRTFDAIARQEERRPEQSVQSRWESESPARPPPADDAPG